MCVLGIWTQVLLLSSQTLLPAEPPPAPCVISLHYSESHLREKKKQPLPIILWKRLLWLPIIRVEPWKTFITWTPQPLDQGVCAVGGNQGVCAVGGVGGRFLPWWGATQRASCCSIAIAVPWWPQFLCLNVFQYHSICIQCTRVTVTPLLPVPLVPWLGALNFLWDAGCQNSPSLPGVSHARKPWGCVVPKCGRGAQTEGYRLGYWVFLLFFSLTFSGIC